MYTPSHRRPAAPILTGRSRRPLTSGCAALLCAGAVLALPTSVGSASATWALGFSASATVSTPTAPESPTDVTTADVNGDLRPDILVTSSDGSSGPVASGLVSVYLSSATAAGPPTLSASYPAGSRAYGIVAGDLDGDTFVDVVTTTYNGVNILRGNGDGTFRSPEYRAAGNLRQPVIADFNGDGHPDIAAADYYHDSFLGAVDVLLNAWDGTFITTRVELGVNTFPGRLTSGDVNGDGFIDLVATNGVFYVLLGAGDGSFAPPLRFAWTYTTSSGQTNFSAAFSDVSIGDFNSDGRPDIAAASTNDTGAGLWFFPGAVGGGLDLANAVSRRINDSGDKLIQTDFDRDGRLDLMVGAGNGAYSPAVVSLRSGSDPWPSLAYKGPGGYVSDYYPSSSVAAADLNGDSLPDLITVDRLHGLLVLRKQQGVDNVPPMVTGTPDRAPDLNGWYTHNVTITWTAVDPAPSSGVPSQPTPTTVVYERANLNVPSGYSTDPDGNSAMGYYYPVSLDKTAPSVSVSAPVDGATYAQGAVTSAGYGCSDAVSGVDTCTGDVANGATFDTAITGPHTFTVTGVDRAGLSTTSVVNYTVAASSGSATQTLPSTGGSVTTDPTGTGATTQVPVQTALTSPSGGTVTIDASATLTTTAPANYDLIGQQIQIEAPVASVTQPLTLTFTVDASKLGLQPDGSVIDASNLTVIRNGVPITASCDPAFAGQAVPDPCVLSRATTTGGDAVITILSSHASTWNFGHRAAFHTSSPFYKPPVDNTGVNVAKAGSTLPLKFSLKGDQGLKIFTTGSPSSTATGICGSNTTKTKPLPGATGNYPTLTYDPVADLYTYSWRTNATWAGTCRQFRLSLIDGTTHDLSFAFTK